MSITSIDVINYNKPITNKIVIFDLDETLGYFVEYNLSI